VTQGLAGKIALITGASSGIGRHLAEVLAGEGVKVACGGRRLNELESVAVGIVGKGGAATPVQLDVSVRASVETAVADVETTLGPIDILINAAGIAAPASFLRMSEDQWADVIEANLTGTWRTSQVVARLMAARKSGVILNISSVAGLAPQSKQTNYCASKAAVIHLTKTMALELGRYGVRVNAIAPGYFHTGINDEFVRSEAGESYVRGLFPGRLGRLEELDEPVKLLLSPGGSFMTGSVLAVDGGTLLRAL